MIVVAIIGIIAAVAYPSYLAQMSKTRRSECSAAMISFGNAMERYFTVNSTYAGAAVPAVFRATCPADGAAATYNLTIQAAGASTFELRAAPTGPQAGDKCGTLTLTNRGLKGVVGANAGITWQNCWS